MELGSEHNLPYGTEVIVNLQVEGIMHFEGIIVGKSTTDLTQSHIVECTDGTIPSREYPYTTVSVPAMLIELKEKTDD